MKIQISTLALVALGLLANPISAQPEEREGDGNRPRGAARERILRAFDKDGDGQLNQEERNAVREQLGDRFEDIRRQVRDLFEERRESDAGDREPRRRDGDRDRPPRRGDGDRPRERGPRDDGSPRDRGPGDRGPRDRPRPDGPRGPMGPMRGGPERDLQALFGWFDMDRDNMLDRREFAELSQFVQRRRPMPAGGPGGPRVSWRGPGGPDEVRVDAIRRLERRRALDRSEENENRDGNPARAETWRRFRERVQRDRESRLDADERRSDQRRDNDGDGPRDDDRAGVRRSIQAI